MMSSELNVVLREAQIDGRAILAANFYNLETLQGIALAAAETKSAIILQLTRGSIDYMGLNVAVALVRSVIYEYGLLAWLHLDHGDSISLVQRCLDAGFDSVMIDGSEKPFVENINLTRKVVELAKPYGVMVEAELGYVPKLGQDDNKLGFTEPDEAKKFVRETKVDALAVAIGSAHGFYKQMPKLDLERLRRIREAVEVPLVLHGGSGIPKEQLKAAIKNGISKINVATETKNAFMKSLAEVMKENDEIDLRKVFPRGIEAVKKLIGEKLKIVENE